MLIIGIEAGIRRRQGHAGAEEKLADLAG